jgi:hypothetical protein
VKTSPAPVNGAGFFNFSKMENKKIHSENERAEIRAWLKSEQDFDEGYELFVRFSHNRALALQLARIRRLSKLVYELEKIADRPFIKESPVMPIKSIIRAGKRHGEHVEVAEMADGAEKKLVIISEKVDYNELPENLKKLYDENTEAYKLMRAVHEKMKQAQKDGERAELRAQLIVFDDRIANNWQELDSWSTDKEAYEARRLAEIQGYGNSNTGGEDLPEITDPNEIAKDLNACRSFISRNLKNVAKLEGEKKEKLLKKLAERVATLQKHKADISGATKANLVELGLLDEDSGNQ